VGETETVEIPAGSAAVSFSFSDADPVAACAHCRWHGHGDSAADAFHAWWQHRNAEHPERMD
jgi:hypothetical protein